MAAGHRTRDERAAAVVDFVLVLVVLVPLFLGILQVALVLHVRNTLTAAASEGARFAATADHGPDDGAELTRSQVSGVLAGSYTDGVTAHATVVDDYPGVVVQVHAEVPALGLFGPAVALNVEGHAVEEQPP